LGTNTTWYLLSHFEWDRLWYSSDMTVWRGWWFHQVTCSSLFWQSRQRNDQTCASLTSRTGGLPRGTMIYVGTACITSSSRTKVLCEKMREYLDQQEWRFVLVTHTYIYDGFSLIHGSSRVVWYD
jgi:hypothetical protein